MEVLVITGTHWFCVSVGVFAGVYACIATTY